MMDNDSECLMASGDARVSISVTDRILLHLWEQDHQADHYLVSYELTRPGIAEVCALHPPNVSRTMREIMNNGWVTEHTRVIRDEERRQKTENTIQSKQAELERFQIEKVGPQGEIYKIHDQLMAPVYAKIDA